MRLGCAAYPGGVLKFLLVVAVVGVAIYLLVRLLERRARAWERSEDYGHDGRFRRRDGDLRWMHVTCKPRFDAAVISSNSF